MKPADQDQHCFSSTGWIHVKIKTGRKLEIRMSCTTLRQLSERLQKRVC